MSDTFTSPAGIAERQRARLGLGVDRGGIVARQAEHDDHQAKVAAAVAIERARDAAERADLDRAVVALAGLWGRDDLPLHVRAQLRALVHDMKVTIGPMAPA